MEKELTAAVTTQEPMLADRLIVVQQLPVIKEQLHSIKAQAQASVAEALALVCTEETLKAVKDRRAALTRDRKDLDARRMVVKNQIMQPFEDFDKVYKECVTDVYGPADEALKGKITDVEAGLKADKEKKVVAYFDELVKANGVEWVSYEDIGIAVTMTASLKSLKSKVKEYVDRVVADVNCINGMLVHNVPNCGYKVHFPSGKAIYATDTNNLNGVQALGYDLYLIEANYRDEDIQAKIAEKKAAGQYAYEMQVLKNHLSEAKCNDFLVRNMQANSVYIPMHVHVDKEKTDGRNGEN